MKNNNDLTKVITGTETRWSYVNVWEPKSVNGNVPKYSVSLIIPKSDTVTVSKINLAIETAYNEGQSKLKGTGKFVPELSSLRTPLRDGDSEKQNQKEYRNCYFINAKSSSAPQIVYADKSNVTDHSEVYSGVYGRASISFYAYNTNGNKGISCELNHLQKFSDGERLGGKPSAEDDFATEDDDFLK